MSSIPTKKSTAKIERRDLEECVWCNHPIIDCRCHYNECKFYQTFDNEDCNCEEMDKEREGLEKMKGK